MKHTLTQLACKLKINKIKNLVIIFSLIALFVQGANAQEKLFKETEEQKKELFRY